MRNIILIVLDTVRKDVFNEYCNRILAQADTTFEQCRAASSWSVPSHASMLTGLLPSSHGVHSHNPDFTKLEEEQTIISQLPDEYQTYGVSANFYASDHFGFDTLFDDFVTIGPHRQFPQGLDLKNFSKDRSGEGIRFYLKFLQKSLKHSHPLLSLANGACFKLNNLSRGRRIPKFVDDGAWSVSRAGQQFVEQDDEPFFLFMNFMDAHGPHEDTIWYNQSEHTVPPTWHSGAFDSWEINNAESIDKFKDDIKNHRELYHTAVEYLDRQVSKFIDKVDSSTENETTFVITADHGENLGYRSDDFLVNHTSSVSESLLHVPFVIVNPPKNYPDRVPEYFTHLDLPELITGISSTNRTIPTRKQVPAEVIGVSGNPDLSKQPDYWNRAIRAVYEGEKKITWDSLGTTKSYTIDANRPCWQRLNKEGIEVPEEVQNLFENDLFEYKNQLQEEGTDQSLNEGVEDRLEDLGYI